MIISYVYSENLILSIRMQRGESELTVKEWRGWRGVEKTTEKSKGGTDRKRDRINNELTNKEIHCI